MEFSRQEDWRRSTHSLLQGLNSGPPHCRQIPPHLSMREAPFHRQRACSFASGGSAQLTGWHLVPRARLLSQGALIPASPRRSPNEGLLSEHGNSQPGRWELKQQALLAIQPSRGA